VNDHAYVICFDTGRLDLMQRQAVLLWGYDSPQWRAIRDINWALKRAY
jgi:hypothetical protein